jgi:hypothetical protein
MGAKAAELPCPDRMKQMGSFTMKTIVSLLVGLAMMLPLMAVEYVTLHKAGDNKIVSSGSLVEVIGYGESNGGSIDIQCMEVTYADSSMQTEYLRKVIYYSNGNVVANPYKIVYTGITKLQLSENYRFAVTLKITPPAEINAVGPTSVLVIPENSTGDYDIILESSTDMTTWTPIHSQSVSSSNPTNLFRTRIVKKTAP